VSRPEEAPLPVSRRPHSRARKGKHSSPGGNSEISGLVSFVYKRRLIEGEGSVQLTSLFSENPSVGSF